MPRDRVHCSLALCAALLAGATTTSLAQCPESRISGQYGGTGQNNLPAGWVAAQSTPSLASGGAVVAVDDFEITGLAPSTIVACTIRLSLTGTLAASTSEPYHHYPGGYGIVSIDVSQSSGRDSAEVFMENRAPQDASVSQNLDLPAIVMAGAPFRLEFAPVVGTELASSGSNLRGEIHFLDLPPRAGVRSCNGFVLNPVAVEQHTWTRIKQLYRGPGS